MLPVVRSASSESKTTVLPYRRMAIQSMIISEAAAQFRAGIRSAVLDRQISDIAGPTNAGTVTGTALRYINVTSEIRNSHRLILWATKSKQHQQTRPLRQGRTSGDRSRMEGIAEAALGSADTNRP